MVRPARPAAISVGNHSASEQTLYGRPLARETVCRRITLPNIVCVAVAPPQVSSRFYSFQRPLTPANSASVTALQRRHNYLDSATDRLRAWHCAHRVSEKEKADV
jgi:hypothetical protein